MIMRINTNLNETIEEFYLFISPNVININNNEHVTKISPDHVSIVNIL